MANQLAAHVGGVGHLTGGDWSGRPQGLEFFVLGPLEVTNDGISMDPGSPKQRAVLAVLLLAEGKWCPSIA